MFRAFGDGRASLLAVDKVVCVYMFGAEALLCRMGGGKTVYSYRPRPLERTELLSLSDIISC